MFIFQQKALPQKMWFSEIKKKTNLKQASSMSMSMRKYVCKIFSLFKPKKLRVLTLGHLNA